MSAPAAPAPVEKAIEALTANVVLVARRVEYMKVREICISAEELYSELLVVSRNFTFFRNHPDSDFDKVLASLPVVLKSLFDLYSGPESVEFEIQLTCGVRSLLECARKNVPTPKDSILILDTMPGCPFWFASPALKSDFATVDMIWEKEAEGCIARHRFPMMPDDFSKTDEWSASVSNIFADLKLTENKGPRMTMMIIWKLFSGLTDMRELMANMLSKACLNHNPFFSQEYAAYFVQAQLQLLCDQFSPTGGEMMKMLDKKPERVLKLLDSVNKDPALTFQLITQTRACDGFTLDELRWLRFAAVMTDVNGTAYAVPLIQAVDDLINKQ